MSIRIQLNNPPEFYTNLDDISGLVVIHLNRPEQVGSIVVKLEGEVVTYLRYPVDDPRARLGPRQNVTPYAEKHKVLYKVQQVFPDEYYSSGNNPFGSFPLQPGSHSFPFNFKFPINNACSDPMAMAALSIAGVNSVGLFGSRGPRLMDGTKQLYLRHVTQTLPPSLTQFQDDAEIRYYVKVTVQRPGFLKENWRYEVGIKFLPIEPPRKQPGRQEAFARRPFTFSATNFSSGGVAGKKESSFLHRIKGARDDGLSQQGGGGESQGSSIPAQSVEISARIPHPPILTCNKPVPLRLVARRLVNNQEQVYLTSFQMDLVSTTRFRAYDATTQRTDKWIVAASPQLEIPIFPSPIGDVGAEFAIPDEAWSLKPLPNTVCPTFVACTISRQYQLQLRVGLSLGKRSGKTIPETIVLPLHFAKVDVYSGIPPPRVLLEATTNAAQTGVGPQLPPRLSASQASNVPTAQAGSVPPALPTRQEIRPHDNIYPTQLQPGESADAGMDAPPPSYSEALADGASPSFDSQNPRPPYSGVTDENAPSAYPHEKS